MPKSIGIQTDPSSPDTTSEDSYFTCKLPRWCVFSSLFLCVIALMSISVLLIMDFFTPRFMVPPDLLEDIGLDGLRMFRTHDRNADGVLDLVEFEPLAHRLLEVNETYTYDVIIEKNDTFVTIQSEFTPLNRATMSTDWSDPKFKSKSPINPTLGLQKWLKVNWAQKNFGSSQFRVFLPDENKYESLGEVYKLIDLSNEEELTSSSNRYFPPLLSDETEIFIHQLLTAFHPRPHVVTRFGPRGAVACVRAYNEDLLEIAFRVHAEFQLNEPPFEPFWFTPAQLKGHLVIGREDSKVYDFSMYVPTDRSLNVDMEWIVNHENVDNMEVDIGFISQMSLHQVSAPHPAFSDGKDLRETFPQEKYQLEKVMWSNEISLEDAESKMQIAMYPFKKVPYYGFQEAFDKARAEHKLVHSVLLWGALDDQSC